MDAIKFIEELRRMATYENNRSAMYHMFVDTVNPEAIVNKVEKWSVAHPRKTRQSVFLEQWPDTQLNKKGNIVICPKQLCKGEELTKLIAECRGTNCDECRHKFWKKEVK